MQRPKTLSAAFLKTIRTPGRYGDGRGGYGLSLLVKPMANGRISKSWSQRLRWQGKPFNLGLGAYPLVTLAEARAAALANARAVAQGIDPRSGGVPSFETATATVIALHEPTWKAGAKTAGMWRASLRDYAFPVIGNMPVDRITSADVLAVLTPIWTEKPELARKIKQRMSAVFKWAIAEGHRLDDPAGPALSAVLPRQNGNGRQHHRALPHGDVAAALATVKASGAYPVTALCMEFVALTACRSGEARQATWAEIDMDAAVWAIPAGRMKQKREHRVPLSSAAVAVLEAAQAHRDASDLVFPSVTGKPLSDNTLSKLLRDLKIPAVPHGFRSSFRDWCAETNQPREIAESALAHTVGNKTEQAYFRSDLFERRRDLMQAWAEYLSA